MCVCVCARTDAGALQILSEHLRWNLVQFGPTSFFLQTRGIPQGSLLSSMLCSCVYAHLEQQRLSPLPSLHLNPPLSAAAAAAITAPVHSPRASRARAARPVADAAKASKGGEQMVRGSNAKAADQSGALRAQAETGKARARRNGKKARVAAGDGHTGSSSSGHVETPHAAAPASRVAEAPAPSPDAARVSGAAAEDPATASTSAGDISRSEASLLLRVVDDFLYISADVRMARAFVRAMACGHGDYGVAVNLDKSSVNFEVQVSIPPHLPRLSPLRPCALKHNVTSQALTLRSRSRFRFRQTTCTCPCRALAQTPAAKAGHKAAAQGQQGMEPAQ